jgi:hypothetical protein
VPDEFGSFAVLLGGEVLLAGGTIGHTGATPIITTDYRTPAS